MVTETRLPTSARRKALVAATVVAAYVFVALVQVMPPSPMRDVLLPASRAVAKPFLVQQWNLFAPDPLRTNQHSIVVVRYRDRSGRTATTEPFDVTAAVRAATRRQRWGPPRIRKAFATMNKALEERAFADVERILDADLGVGDVVPPRLVRRILRGRESLLGVWDRMLSAVAPQLVPTGGTPVELRGYLVMRRIKRFSERDERSPIPYPALPAPDDPTVVLPPGTVALTTGGSRSGSLLVLDSGWRELVRDVEPLEVVR